MQESFLQKQILKFTKEVLQDDKMNTRKIVNKQVLKGISLGDILFILAILYMSLKIAGVI